MIRILKPFLLLLLIFTSFVHADEIGSQYKAQAEAGDARAQYYLAGTVQLRLLTASRRRCGQRKRQKGGDIDAMALLSQIHFTQGDYAQAKALAQQATIAGSKRGAIMLARVLVNTVVAKQTTRRPSNCCRRPPKISTTTLR